MTGEEIDTARSARPRTGLWVAVAFFADLGLAAAVLVVFGRTGNGFHLALLATARVQFLLFWPAYAGAALASLFGRDFLPLARDAREWGLAFAAALAVHLGLVAWACAIGDVPPVQTFFVFGFAAACAYALALFSIAHLRQILGPQLWKLLSFVAMNYIALAFADDFLSSLPGRGLRHAVLYWPFAALAIAGPALRFAAFAKAIYARASRLAI